MIVTVMDAKGMRQFNVSRHIKLFLLGLGIVVPIVLLGLGYSLGGARHLAPITKTPPPVPTLSVSQPDKSLAKYQSKIQQLEDQLRLLQASQSKTRLLEQKLQQMTQTLQQAQSDQAEAQTQIAKLQSSLIVAQTQETAPPSPAPDHSAIAQIETFKLLAQRPLLIDWLQLQHTIINTYKPVTAVPTGTLAKHKTLRLSAHNKPTLAKKSKSSPIKTWGVSKTFRAKARTLRQRKPFDRLYRRRSFVERVAKKQLGKHYVWGSVGPRTFDCSGFTSYVFRKVGFSIPRTSRNQAKFGKRISRRNLKPGDLIFFDTSHTRRGYVNHVGIYIGHNRFIHASSARRRVIITSLNKAFYSQRFKWGRRVVN